MKLLAPLAARVVRIRARTWMLLGATGFVLLGTVVWAGFAMLSWLWTQAPVAIDAGKRIGGEAATRIEQAAPGLRERLEQWVPDLAQAPAHDVSGTDIGPVPRYPGLARSHFAREGQVVEVRYVGRATHNAVLAHYVQGFAAAGYAQEVMSATSEGERHRFRRGRETIELSLSRRPDGLAELRLRQPAEQ